MWIQKKRYHIKKTVQKVKYNSGLIMKRVFWRNKTLIYNLFIKIMIIGDKTTTFPLLLNGGNRGIDRDGKTNHW